MELVLGRVNNKVAAAEVKSTKRSFLTDEEVHLCDKSLLKSS